MISVLRSVLYLWTTFSLCGHTMAAPSRDCDCTDPRDFARCGCDESAAAEKSRTKRDLSTSWNDGPISPDEQGVAELKRSPEVGNSLGDAHALNAVFRWGKRNAADDVSSAYSNVFRWGKRSPIFGYDVPEVGGDDSSQDSVDSGDIKRIFRWGKRSRGPSASVFRWGKRSRENGNPPVFRWGKRDYRDDLRSDLGTLSLFQWPGKRIDDGQYPEQRYTPVFRWGKRQNSDKGNRRQTASLFRWGKRSVDALQQVGNSLGHYGNSDS